MTSEVIMDPVPPGEILLEEFLLPLGVSQYRLAKAISVPARRINEIVHGQRRISADTALRLSRLLRDVGAVLAQPTGSVRPGDREGQASHGAGRHRPTATRKLMPAWSPSRSSRFARRRSHRPIGHDSVKAGSSVARCVLNEASDLQFTCSGVTRLA